MLNQKNNMIKHQSKIAQIVARQNELRTAIDEIMAVIEGYR